MQLTCAPLLPSLWRNPRPGPAAKHWHVHSPRVYFFYDPDSQSGKLKDSVNELPGTIEAFANSSCLLIAAIAASSRSPPRASGIRNDTSVLSRPSSAYYKMAPLSVLAEPYSLNSRS